MFFWWEKIGAGSWRSKSLDTEVCQTWMHVLQLLVYTKLTEWHNFNDFWSNFFIWSKKHYTETLKKGTKLVVLGKLWLENPEDSILKTTSWQFWNIRSPSQVTKRIVITTNIPQLRKPFDCDFGGRNEPVGENKDDFECRERMKGIVCFAVSDCEVSDANRKLKIWFVKHSPKASNFKQGPRYEITKL